MRFKGIQAALLLSVVVGLAMSQPPGDGNGKGAPPRFVLGRIFPPVLREELKLTKEQEKDLEAIEKDLAMRLNKLLTARQKKTADEFRPKGAAGKGSAGGGGVDRPDRPSVETAPMPNV